MTNTFCILFTCQGAEKRQYRKIIVWVMAAAVCMSMATPAAAASKKAARTASKTASKRTVRTVKYNYVDADGDGICDYFAQNGRGCGRYFVDADGDGICDNYTENGCGAGCGCGAGYGRGGGRGAGLRRGVK